ncbi:MAG: DnaJ domain-containing protein [Parvibaculaceae bacterium]|nr:DnaJ domain-containing protein [Parvibaculaceae bacterium]
MTKDSKYFDSIRIAPQKAKERAKLNHRICDWPNCDSPAPHRAPKRGPTADNAKPNDKFNWFCVAHIKEHNKQYNYFEGMSEEEARTYREQAATGHRPTWQTGVDGSFGTSRLKPEFYEDSLGVVNKRKEARVTANRDKADMPKRAPRNAERKALEALGLDEFASLPEIKTRYKDLVKKFHPDRNGGDRDAEDRLHHVLQAYDYLKKSGFC